MSDLSPRHDDASLARPRPVLLVVDVADGGRDDRPSRPSCSA
ncbi:hypothetical protein [Frigoribacterium faeni]|nr:hypothetical protein [Frigoribacterium faeni]NIJ04454.1 hypothetical protein [Frigoribacterium faeni]